MFHCRIYNRILLGETMKIIFILLLIITVLLSGCIEQTPLPEVRYVTPTPEIKYITPQPIEPVIQIDTEYIRFENFLVQDNTSEHPYTDDTSLSYKDRYMCAHYSRDLLLSGRKSGYKMYAAHFTGTTEPGKYSWHMAVVVRLDNKWYFVEPQADEIISMSEAYNYFNYEYATIGSDIYIERNDGNLNGRIRNEDGLINGDYIYLKR